MTFFQVIIKIMAASLETMIEKLEQVKINNDSYFGNDLSSEKQFLEKAREKIQEKIPDVNVSFFYRKRSMAFSFTIQKINEAIIKELLHITDWEKDQYFFRENILQQLGWCCHYLIDSRSVNYKKEEQGFEKVEIVEFYWFNSSPNRFMSRTILTEFEIHNCTYRHFQ